MRMNAPAPPNWLTRNWKWAVPTGCLTLLVLAGGFMALVFWFVFSVMKSSDVYAQGVERARAAPAVAEALGTPIEEGWFMSGQINVAGPSGHADIAVPLSGPRAKGTLYIVADKSAGEWHFRTLQVAVDGAGKRIDLMQ